MLGIQVNQGSHFKVDTLSFGTASSAATPFYPKKNGMFSQRKTLYIRNLLHQTFDIFSQMPFNFNLFNNDNNDDNNNNNNNFYTKKNTPETVLAKTRRACSSPFTSKLFITSTFYKCQQVTTKLLKRQEKKHQRRI